MNEQEYVISESELKYLINSANQAGQKESLDYYDKVSGQTSDGYHTFDELYEHRYLLFLNLMQSQQKYCYDYQDKEQVHPWWSKKHNDGSSIEGYFIAGLYLGIAAVQITYHLPLRYMPLLKDIRELDTAPSWDGHRSADVIERLKENLS